MYNLSSVYCFLSIHSYLLSQYFQVWNITILGKVSVTKWKTWMKYIKVKAVLACPQITYFQVDKGFGMTQSFTCCVLRLKFDFAYQWFIKNWNMGK